MPLSGTHLNGFLLLFVKTIHEMSPCHACPVYTFGSGKLYWVCLLCKDHFTLAQEKRKDKDLFAGKFSWCDCEDCQNYEGNFLSSFSHTPTVFTPLASERNTARHTLISYICIFFPPTFGNILHCIQFYLSWDRKLRAVLN